MAPGADRPASARTIAGADACRAGWIAVIGHLAPPPADGSVPGEGWASIEARVFPRFDFLLDALPSDAVIAVANRAMSRYLDIGVSSHGQPFSGCAGRG